MNPSTGTGGNPMAVPPPPSILSKWRALGWARRAMLCEALIFLVLAFLAVALIPFRVIVRVAAPYSATPFRDPGERLELDRLIRWAVLACARRVPFRAMCFEQGLAAQWMLRRRGVPSTLYYGAAPDDAKGLAAHVWVKDGDIPVVGCEVADRFAILAMFPPRQQAVR